MSEAERILALIADPARLRVVAALALGATSVADAAAMTSLDVRTVERALARLAAGSLVVADAGGYRLATEEILAAARAASAERKADRPGGEVLGRFFRDGRLATIPSSRSKRLVVLDHIAQAFEPGRRYPEKEVNEILRRVHDDVASLRRYLVDEHLMERDHGEYWRAGGTFDVG